MHILPVITATAIPVIPVISVALVILVVLVLALVILVILVTLVIITTMPYAILVILFGVCPLAFWWHHQNEIRVKISITGPVNKNPAFSY